MSAQYQPQPFTPLLFVQPGVLQRVVDGRFVPERQAKPGPLTLDDRRDTLSPLAVTKRCIRYIPRVFANRRPQVVEIAQGLNSPQTKVVFITGGQGSGKTSLARGVVELMGGGPEQLLWFDTHRHTQVDDILQFFFDYIPYVCHALQQAEPNTRPTKSMGGDPLAELETLLIQLAHVPLLVVLDNVENLVNEEHRLTSQPLKETLNFLLSFPNIKLMLLGERMPEADLSNRSGALLEIKLSGLSEADMGQALDPKAREDAPLLHDLFQKTWGMPWLVHVLLYLQQKSQVDLEDLNELLEESRQKRGLSPVEALARFLYGRLTPAQQRVAEVLACLRHPTSLSTLAGITRLCFLDEAKNLMGLDLEGLEHWALKPVLKKTYPPQRVLDHIRQAQRRALAKGGPEEKPFQPWYELYRAMKKAFYYNLSQETRARLHERLHAFYQAELEKPAQHRIYAVPDRVLQAELRYHQNAMHHKRPSAKGPTAPLREAGTLSTQAYLSKSLRPTSLEKTYTLDDFRRITLPGSDTLEVTVLAPQQTPAKVTLQATAELPVSVTAEPVVVELPTLAFPTTPQVEEVAPPPSVQPTVPVQTIDNQTMDTAPMDAVGRDLQQSLAEAVAQRDRGTMMSRLCDLARYWMTAGRYAEAEQCLEKASSLTAESTMSQQGRAYLLGLRGTLYKETYRHNQAVEALQQALSLLPAKHEGSAVLERARILQDLGDIHAFRGNSQAALTAYQEALPILAQSQEPQRQAEVFFKAAQILEALARPEEALRYYQKALTLDRTQNNPVSCAAALANIGGLYLNQGAMNEAIEAFRQSLDFDQQADNPEGAFHTLLTLGLAYAIRQEFQQAEQAYQQALTLAQGEGRSTWQATAYMSLGDFYRDDRQNPGQAMACYQAAQDAAWEELSEDSQAQLHSRMVSLEAVSGHHR